MAGTIVVDRLESDASYASSINIASPVIISNTTTFRSNSTISTTTAESLRLHRSGSSSQISSVVMEDGGSSVGTANTVRLSTSLGALSISTGGTGGSSTGGTEYARVEANGVFNLVSGQLRFPASQNASSDANTFDDYEEGSWTVSPTRWTWSGSKTGSYIKIGRLVHVNYVVDATGISYTGAGSGWAIGGFPFTIDSVAIAQLSECTAFNTNLFLDNIGNELFGRTASNSTSGIGAGTNFNSSGRIKFTVTYYTNA